MIQPGGADRDASAPDDIWWRSAVVYQIYPRSFSDSDGDGIGDLPGITARLDHLAELGVDVLWLSPVYPSPQDDNGYDISNYTDIEPVFGTLGDFDALLAGAHERGLKLIMDLVVNHTSDEHPWFVESRSSTDNPKRDWYWWRPEPATDWQSAFSGPAWQLDEVTGEYYLHLFSRKQPDLNWENREVRAAVYDMMRWWLDRGVDGFRMDVINMISKDLDTGVYLHGPRLHEFLNEMNREVVAPHPVRLLTVGEMPGVTVEQARLFTDPARAEVDMVFQFEHVNIDQGNNKWDVLPLDLRLLKASLGRWQAGLADVGWNSLYWNNHDQPRAVSRFGSDAPQHRVAAAKLLATVLHLHRGTPYVYQGEELGMTNSPFAAITDFRDIESINYHTAALATGLAPEGVLAALRSMSRDNARSPVQWDASPNAGFTTGDPWLPVNPNHVEINAADQWADPGSVLHHYRALISLRHNEPAVVHGDFTMLLPDDPVIYAFTRRLGAVELLVLANFSDDTDAVRAAGHRNGPPEWDPAEWDTAELVLGNLTPAPALPASTPLRPWEARVLRRVRG